MVKRETGGFLDVVLAQIADFQAREKELRSKVVTAMLYPTILLVLGAGVLIFLLVFFIPRFQAIFSGFGAALPLIRRSSSASVSLFAFTVCKSRAAWR